ncbi:hypothetical protein D3C72_487010 [compost metagenome]
MAGLALGMGAFFFSVTRPTLGSGWSGVRAAREQEEPTSAEKNDGGGAADEQRLVGCALAHHWAPWKGARPSWRASSISAWTRARRASTAEVRAEIRAVRVTRSSSWEILPASVPIRDRR